MKKIPEGITVGTSYGNISRKIKENMTRYLETGRKEYYAEVCRLSLKREKLISK